MANLFDLKLAFWQLRGEKYKIILIIFCIALGVSGRVAVGSFLAELSRSLREEARGLLAGDLEISSRDPLNETQRAQLRGTLPPGTAFQNIASFVTMAASAKTGRSRLVEMRAVEPGYPFYGELQISGAGGQILKSVERDEPVVFVQKELLSHLGLALNDPLRIGRKDFRIAGILLRDPGLGGGVFSLGPKVLIPIGQIKNTGLVERGSRVYYSILARLPDSSLAEASAEKLKDVWQIPQRKMRFRQAMGPEEGIYVRTAQDKQEQIREFFERLGDYLRLVSLCALLLGGIGVGSVVQGYVMENLASIAVLCTLGATKNRILRVITLQLLIVGFAASLAGSALGIAIQNLIPALLSSFIPIQYQARIHPGVALSGMALGVAASLFFGIVSLESVRRLKPVEIFRGDNSLKTVGPATWALYAMGAVALSGVAVLESRSIVKGLYFSGSFLSCGALLYYLSRWILPAFARLKSMALPFPVRHGLANLARPKLRPYSACVALGLAAFLLGVLTLYKFSLLSELDRGQNPVKIPSFFVIDIQDDQVEGLKSFLEQKRMPQFVFSPMVKARYSTKNGKPLEENKIYTREDEEKKFFREREQNLSYRDNPGENEEITEGRWITPGPDAEISMEEQFADRLGVKMGDLLGFDIQGVMVSGKITSLRKVNWASFLPAFFIYFTPQALMDAPKTWVGSILGINPAARDDLQTELITLFPNLTIINVAQITEKIIQIASKITWAIQFMALFSLAAGLVVLTGIAVAGARQRRTEAGLLKVLGGTWKTLVSAWIVEYGVLGGVSAALGLGLSVAFGWVFLEKILDLSFSFPLKGFLLIFAAIPVLSALTGLLVSRKALSVKPLQILREI